MRGSKAHRPARRAAKIVAVATVAIVLATGTLSSSAAEDPTFPGLPSYPQLGKWVGPRASGMTEVSTAQQSVRLPPLVVAGYLIQTPTLVDNACRRLGDYRSVKTWDAELHFVSSPGAVEPYGYIGPFTARTVAFGSIPVEADVELAQPRGVDNLPIGYRFSQQTNLFCAGRGPHAGPAQEELHWPSFRFDAPIDISITGLRIDGIDLGLSSSCRGEERSVLTIGMDRDYLSLDPSITPEERPSQTNRFTTPFFGAANGGLLTGDIDIPRFTGCTTRTGEDVSALLTATVSGESNGVEIRSEGLEDVGCISDPASCEPLPGLPFPERD